MTERCISRHVALLVLIALATQGCVTGHLLDAARRREQLLSVEAASVDDERLYLAYRARVVDDLGVPVAAGERRVAIALADLRRGDVPVDAFPAERLADDAALPGQAVALAPSVGCGVTPPFLVVEGTASERPLRLVLHESNATADPPLYTNALTHTRTEPWVIPLLPLSAAFDAVSVPILIVLGPLVIALGD